VAADVAREGKLLEEALHPFIVFALVGIDLAVGTLQVNRTENARSPVARTGHEDHVQVVLFDQPIAVNVGEAEGGRGTPVAQQAVLDLLWLEGFSQQGVIPQVNHTYGQVVTGAPVGMNFAQFFVG